MFTGNIILINGLICNCQVAKGPRYVGMLKKHPCIQGLSKRIVSTELNIAFWVPTERDLKCSPQGLLQKILVEQLSFLTSVNLPGWQCKAVSDMTCRLMNATGRSQN